MRLLRPLTLAAILSCLCAAGAPAQSARAKHAYPPGPGRGGDEPHGGGGPGKSKQPEDYSRVFTTREVTQRARITRRPEPAYPREARDADVTGTVRLRLILRADGRVDNKIEVIKPLPGGCTEEAVKAARRVEFVPAQKDGRKVSQYALVEYNFNFY